MFKTIQALFQKYREQILYLIFGGATTAVNFVVYWICSGLNFGTAVSTIIAWFLSVVFAYVTNKIFVFESKIHTCLGILKEAASFFLSRLATGILDLGIMLLFVDVLHLNELLMKILSNILVILLNYLLSKLFIFKKAKKNSTK